MKRIYALTSIIIFISTFAFGQWFWQSPLPQGNNLNTVVFVNQDTGYIAGAFGTILKTTNAGEDWVCINHSNLTLLNIFFLNDNTGFFSGTYGAIFKTNA